MPTLETDGIRVVTSQAREAHRRLARAGLSAAADELQAIAAGLRESEARILEASVLMASDPALLEAVEALVTDDGLTAADALLAATESHARVLAELDDAHLAARADDVRALGRHAAAATLAGAPPSPAVPDGAVVVARDLGPGDVPQVAGSAVGIALAEGGPTAHAAIVARSLGIPMVCGLGDELLSLRPGEPVLLDGERGAMTIEPADRVATLSGARRRARAAESERDRLDRDVPSVTRDGREVRVLANVASLGEVRVAIACGATGAGLVRTELAFLGAEGWPTAGQHRAAVEPLLTALGPRPAVVRVLDVGGDKSPPFVPSGAGRGLALLLAERVGFEQQLEGLLPLGDAHDLRLLLPLVEGGAQMRAARRRIDAVARRVGCPPVPVGAMVETPAAVREAAELAGAADFLSIGTNDLTAATLGGDRARGSVEPAHHPRVLRHVHSAIAAAADAGIPVSVCGEAASMSLTAGLLVGLGVQELSVGAARVGAVRRWVRGMHYEDLAAVARRGLACDTPEQVARLVADVGRDGGGA